MMNQSVVPRMTVSKQLRPIIAEPDRLEQAADRKLDISIRPLK